ncbi:MAG: right-handed parallel beta-helix repeat-containing protein, partial [Blastocatellia bacterium]
MTGSQESHRYLIVVIAIASFVALPSRVSSKDGVKIYVNGSMGSDSNPGSQSRPLRTIGKAALIAVANHDRNIATTVAIAAGVYREAVTVSGRNADVGAPIAFEAIKPGAVIISGSDIWTGWRADPNDPRRYVHSWPYTWGACPPIPHWPAMSEIVARREMVFVNGSLLTQVISRDELQQGSFFVDEASGQITLWPAAGTDMASSTVEVSLRPKLFESHLISHLTLSGLTFEHANPCVSMTFPAAVAIVHGSDETLDDCTFEWNNWQGLALAGVTDTVLHRVVANSNGELGIAGSHLVRITLDGVETSRNNWRGAWGQFFGWEPGGGKFLFVHGGSFKDYTAVGNQANGLWFDTGNEDINVDRAFLKGNRLNGLFMEANEGPITITSSRICGNSGGGIESDNSARVTLTNNVIADNGGYQIFVDGASPQRTWKNSQTGTTSVATEQGWSLGQNIIMGKDASQILFKTYQSSPDSSRLFFSTMQSDHNTWYNAAGGRVMQLDRGGAGHKPRNIALAE